MYNCLKTIRIYLITILFLLLLFFQIDQYLIGEMEETSLEINPDNYIIIDNRSNIPGQYSYKNTRSEPDLILQKGYITDDFVNDSKINFSDNLVIDRELLEVRLQRTDTFLNTYGGFERDEGFCVEPTSDGGFILIGYTESNGSGEEDIWLIKTNSFGKIEWNKTYGGSEDETGYSVKQTTDGGYVLVGNTESYGAGLFDAWIIKTDTFGTMEWNRTFGTKDRDWGRDVIQTLDGGYIITGKTGVVGNIFTDVWLVKVDKDGNEEWKTNYGGDRAEWGESVEQTSDKGYIIVGTKFVTPWQEDIYLIKTDEYGVLQWENTFGGNDRDFGSCVRQTPDSGYILIGRTGSYGPGVPNLWLIKTDSSGYEQWNRTFGGDQWDWGTYVDLTTDSGYILGGFTESFGAGDYDAWLIKTDSYGVEQWSKTYGGEYYEDLYWVQQTANGGYIFIGDTTSYSIGRDDVWLVKTDELGNATKDFGILSSINLLEDLNVSSIDLFYCSASIPLGTNIQVQFSQDGYKWLSSSGIINGSEQLKNGSNSIQLSLLGWNGSKFYYNMTFSSENLSISSLQNIKLSFTRKISPEELDTDNDDLPDLEDTDDDNDGYLDDWERYLNTSETDPNDRPIDTDSDGKPNGNHNNTQVWMDFDDDNDGYSDKKELDSETDPTDPEDHPKKDNDNEYDGEVNYTLYLVLVLIVVLILIISFVISNLTSKK